MVKEVQITAYQCERKGCNELFVARSKSDIKDVTEIATHHEQSDAEHINTIYLGPKRNLLGQEKERYELVLTTMDGDETLGTYDGWDLISKARLDLMEKYRTQAG